MTDPVDSRERLATLEAQMIALRGLPDRMTRVEEKVGGYEKTLFREVDGLREQQKSHKEEIKSDISSLQTSVDTLGKLATTGKTSLRTLLWIGGAIGGLLTVSIAAINALKNLATGS